MDAHELGQARSDVHNMQAACNKPAASTPEQHAKYKDHLSNIIIGFSGGLTVPFALTAELTRKEQEVHQMPNAEEQEIHDIFAEYGISHEASTAVAQSPRANPDMYIKFMMHFKLRLEKPGSSKSWLSALFMGLSYFIGGLIPMIPYFCFKNVYHALFASIGISVVILLTFGYVKAHITGLDTKESAFSAVQTLIVGAFAAATSYGIVRGLDRQFKMNGSV
ncbi:CCC1 [Fusarium acutatum]|uniref:CCC1 n=1 Tax=Fusarium acutatum TaxID=78861 RepID=A0A8H4J9Y9_9HYPO|nr:CCC1 [Fusarium acutatum]